MMEELEEEKKNKSRRADKKITGITKTQFSFWTYTLKY